MIYLVSTNILMESELTLTWPMACQCKSYKLGFLWCFSLRDNNQQMKNYLNVPLHFEMTAATWNVIDEEEC